MHDSTSREHQAAATAIEARGLGKKYRRGWALDNCSFRVPAGRICGLVGPNGAGKSTLMAMMASLLEPSTGTLRVFGDDPRSVTANRRTALLAQERPLFRRFRVDEILRMGRELNPGWDQKAAEDIIRAGNVPLDARINTLSGGQHTRVAIALSLGKRPDLLLLDEPMSDLDPLVRDELMNTLVTSAAENGTTVLVSSHLLSELDNFCDYLLVVKAGELRLAGEVDELLAAHTVLTRTGGGAPEADLAHHLVVENSVDKRTGRALSLIRPQGPIGPSWEQTRPDLEQLLMAYLRSPDTPPLICPSATVDVSSAILGAAA